MIALYLLGLMYGCWVLYLAVMNLKRARDAGTINKTALVFGYPLLFVGLVVDFLTNVTACTILFFELPREWLVTARLKRHAPNEGWRGGLARWVAAELLDDYDPSGKHV